MSIRAEQVRYTYPTGETLGPFDVVWERGELIVVAGPSGSGKSTLVRLLAGIAGRHGTGHVRGTLTVEGVDPAGVSSRKRLETIGFVPQELAHALVADTVEEELAFPLESMGLSSQEIRDRVDVPHPYAKTATLSGGQRQKLASQAAGIGGAQWLILDEPLAHLDPASALEAISQWRAWCDAGFGVVVAEHRLEHLFDVADRLVWMEGGRILGQSAPRAAPLDELRRLGISIPGMVDLADRLGRPLESVPGTPRSCSPRVPGGPPILTAGPLSVRFERPILEGVTLEVLPGESIALLGANGSGKSTCLRCLEGDLDGGPIKSGRVLAVPQDPDLALFCATVREELAYGAEDSTERWIDDFDLRKLLERGPQGLSRGQRMRVAVAAALACKPRVLLLDEPTAGQDRAHAERMLAAIVKKLDHSALVFATHDVEWALRFSHRVIVLDQGKKIADGPPELLFELESTPLVIPPLMRWCWERGLPFESTERLAEVIR